MALPASELTTGQGQRESGHRLHDTDAICKLPHSQAVSTPGKPESIDDDTRPGVCHRRHRRESRHGYRQAQHASYHSSLPWYAEVGRFESASV